MPVWLSLSVSLLALTVSGITAWLTFFRRGKLVMTQPSMIFFGPDGSDFEIPKNKIYLRTLLYSTAKRGHVMESLYLSVYRNGTKQNFDFWAYGEKNDLKRGSGLFVPQEGITFDHHFLVSTDGVDFLFLEGQYKLVVCTRLVGKAHNTELMKIDLSIDVTQSSALAQLKAGIFFDYDPEQQTYHARIERRPELRPKYDRLLQVLSDSASDTESH
jgi:hypothetical protein